MHLGGALYRPQPESELDGIENSSAQEYVLSYLQWLDPKRAGLPAAFKARLEKVLARYGVTVNAVAPGALTRLTADLGLPDEMLARFGL